MNRSSLYIPSPYGPVYLNRSQVLMDPDDEERARTTEAPPLEREEYWEDPKRFNARNAQNNLNAYYERKKRNGPPHN